MRWEYRYHYIGDIRTVEDTQAIEALGEDGGNWWRSTAATCTSNASAIRRATGPGARFQHHARWQWCHQILILHRLAIVTASGRSSACRLKSNRRHRCASA